MTDAIFLKKCPTRQIYLDRKADLYVRYITFEWPINMSHLGVALRGMCAWVNLFICVNR